MRHIGYMTIPSLDLPGLGHPISRLVLGCDNKDTVEEGAPVWDHWVASGGTAFDTAFVYGGGRHEAALGHWLTARRLGDEVTVIVKGAHTPHCTPEAIGLQLGQSLERLQLDRAPIYIMHRDNLDVPVGEFIDAISADTRIGLWGGSNWSVARLREAQAYAASHGRKAPSILNNNLSLAVMEKPVWPGCISSNAAADLAFLRQGRVIHVSWSSQARGYFLPADLRDRLPEDTRPETCFGSPANAERRSRAERLAIQHGATANHVALAWVLSQAFPSLALVGCRTVEEIDSTLPGALLQLTPREAAWLNLEVN